MSAQRVENTLVKTEQLTLFSIRNLDDIVIELVSSVRYGQRIECHVSIYVVTTKLV